MAYFCGPVRNCGKYLQRVFANIEILGRECFADDYKIVIFYDHSTDNTLQILKEYQRTHPLRLQFFVNTRPLSKYRTHNIAFARNQCIQYVRTDQPATKYPYFIMMDFDDVNAKTAPKPHVLRQYLADEYADKWDALSFNTAPFYYDIWALSIYPYCYSYNHFKNNGHYYNVIKDHVTAKLAIAAKQNRLLQCISAFNGFAIYRIDAFAGCTYDGRTNPLLLPTTMMKAHMNATKSPLVFPVYPVADCRVEDCEHRAFHVQAFMQMRAKIRISPLCLFGG